MTRRNRHNRARELQYNQAVRRLALENERYGAALLNVPLMLLNSVIVARPQGVLLGVPL
jgi:hypothetical protein